MKVLLIHHLEPCWSDALNRLTGRGFRDWAERLAEALDGHTFDRIILTQFEDNKPSEGHIETGLAQFVNTWHEYAYGWEKDCQKFFPGEYVEGGNHSESVWTPDWLKALKGASVTLCGAFDGECIEDMEIALRACNVKFKRWNDFIV